MKKIITFLFILTFSIFAAEHAQAACKSFSPGSNFDQCARDCQGAGCDVKYNGGATWCEGWCASRYCKFDKGANQKECETNCGKARYCNQGSPHFGSMPSPQCMEKCSMLEHFRK